uniref:hydrogenase maturation nickel metallochaperone HypA n=1 Tax=Ndongobacter massiliensis TaxID=1871025 RepID=UPI00092FE945|nr:hydrogenase maturation nickel metallochaperone HypA [Ndongobacter massiliensis]
MHELGIVLHFIDRIEKAAEENNAQKVLEVTLEVGEVSTIVPSYFKDCYNWAIKKTKYMQECTLNLLVLQALSYCKSCAKTYPTTKYGKTCPHCGSADTYLVCGGDVTIKDMKIV